MLVLPRLEERVDALPVEPGKKIFVSQPYGIPWALLALAIAGCVALAVWLWPGSEVMKTPPTVPEAKPVVQQPQTPKPEPRPSNSEISTEALRGEGLQIAEWLQK